MGINVVFMGSPDFAVPILKGLLDRYRVVGVVTQPDKPAGRGKSLTSPPVKVFAEQYGLPCIQPHRLKEESAFEQLVQWKPDVIIVAAYGQILRQNVLELPRFGCINVHASLLPRWRGASPIQAAILAGDDQTGVTIMRMEQGLDTGPIYGQSQTRINDEETAESLTNKLAGMGSDLLQELLPLIISGKITPKPQDNDLATSCGLIRKEDAILLLTESADVLVRKVRAYYPWPIARLQIKDMELSILKARHVDIPDLIPEETYIYQKLPAIATTNGLLILDQVQKPGKSVMDGKAFLNGVKNWGIRL